MAFSLQVHVVDQDSRRRALIAYELAESAMRAEVYENLTEFERFAPPTGLVLLNVDAGIKALNDLKDYFRSRGNFLPVATYSTFVDVRLIVECVQNGAADYLAWPIISDDVLDTIDRCAKRGGGQADVEGRRASARLAVAELSARERQVLEFMVRGLSNKETAAILGISSRTVEIHRGNVIKKLGARNTPEAVRIGVYASSDI